MINRFLRRILGCCDFRSEVDDGEGETGATPNDWESWSYVSAIGYYKSWSYFVSAGMRGSFARKRLLYARRYTEEKVAKAGGGAKEIWYKKQDVLLGLSKTTKGFTRIS